MSVRPTYACEGSTTVLTDYHICRYDPVLGVVVAVGDDCDMLILGSHMCRRRVPIRRGVHWLDCHVYAGTSSVLLLSPETIDCVNYKTGVTLSSLSAGSASRLTCLHVPQGLTCGAVGRHNGVVSYFRVCDVSEREQKLFWAVTESSIATFGRVFLGKHEGTVAPSSTPPSNEDCFFPMGSCISLDSLTENPSTFIGVVAGLPGVVEWAVDAGKLSGFYDARSVAPTSTSAETSPWMLGVARYTPGGHYVVATTTDSAQVFVWDLDGKKKGKPTPIHWMVDLSSSITNDYGAKGSVRAFQQNEYRVGMFLARSKTGGGALNDKNSVLFMLLNGQRDIVEVVLRLQDKQLLGQEQVIADLNAYTAEKGSEAKVKLEAEKGGEVASYFKVFHMEPCAPHGYWRSDLTDYDLDSLIITSSGGLRPLVVKRNRDRIGLESIEELREFSGKAPWSTHSMVLQLPLSDRLSGLRQSMREVKRSPIDVLLFGGSRALLPSASSARRDSTEVYQTSLEDASYATVMGWGETVLLSPECDQILRFDVHAIQGTPPWSLLADQHSNIVLEEALPLGSTQVPAEILLRVTAFQEQVLVIKYNIRLETMRTVLALDRDQLRQPKGSGALASKAILIDGTLTARDSGVFTFAPWGKCLALVLEDSSIAFVDLRGGMGGATPPILVLPASDFVPSGAHVVAVEALWVSKGAAVTDTLLTIVLLSDGKGVAVWNMQTLTSQYFSQFNEPTAYRLLLSGVSPPELPQCSGEVGMLSVDLTLSKSPTEPSEYGEIELRDAAGGVLFVVKVGFGLSEGASREWCMKVFKGSQTFTEWIATGFCLNTTRLSISFSILEDTKELHWKCSSTEAKENKTSESSFSPNTSSDYKPFVLRGTISYVSASWRLGKVLLFTQVRGELLPKRHVLQGEGRKTELSQGDPTLLIVGPQHINSLHIRDLLQGSRDFAVPTIRLDNTRKVEDICLQNFSSPVLIVLTRDGYGWRWINLLDPATLQPLLDPALVTLDFAGEEQVKILLVGSTDSQTLVHAYLVGPANGAIGHYRIGVRDKVDQPMEDSFWMTRMEPVPGSFRNYQAFLPRRPTQKSESSFLKRLMQRPWEDIAEELVQQTFMKVSRGEELDQSTSQLISSLQTSGDATSVQRHVDTNRTIAIVENTEKSRRLSGQLATPLSATVSQAKKPISFSTRIPPTASASMEGEKGSRYAALKAVAQRENVSLTEARRMMSENARKLQQRGEQLGRLDNKSEELASRALTFQDLARQLKEKQKNSWF